MASDSSRTTSPAFSTHSDKPRRLRRAAAVDIPEKVPLVLINDKVEDNEERIYPENTTEIPLISSRAGEENPEDSSKAEIQPYSFPYAPSTRFGTETESLPDVNVYQQKKTLAKGMMDVALFSANVNQLRYVLQSNSKHPYFYPSLLFISTSLIFQLAVGIGLTWNATYNVKDKKEICIANKINNFTVLGIFIVTVVNVFISAFCVANVPPMVG